MKTFANWLQESTIHMGQYMERGHPIPPDFSVHKPEFKNSKPELVPIHKLRYGQSAIRSKISPDTKTKPTDPISVAANPDGTYTIGDGHHRAVEHITSGKTHIWCRVHRPK